MNSVRSEFKELLGSTAEQIKTQVKRALPNRICIGITGFSKSGKSTLLTSLINQLVQYPHAQLGGFSPWLNQRLLGVRLHPLEQRGLAQFDYSGNLTCLTADTPHWPPSTQELSGVLLELKLKTRHRKLRSGYRSVFVELRDYPGEWLMDLPLLNQSFQQWSHDWLERMQTPPWASLAGNPLEQFRALDPTLPADPRVIRHYSDQFFDALRAAQRSGSILLQPGRALMDAPDASLPRFFPIPSAPGQDSETERSGGTSEDSYQAQLEAAFESYKRDYVLPFYRDFVAPVERQLLLVDLLGLLKQGPEYLTQLREALALLSGQFRYGRGALFRPRIEKTVFAATKVDQLMTSDHETARHLVSQLVRTSIDQMRYSDLNYRVEAVAGVRSSVERELSQQQTLCGVDEAGEAIGYIHPELPDHLPSGSDWSLPEGWTLPQLRPPSGVRANLDQALPHIRLDRILEELIGDLCR